MPTPKEDVDRIRKRIEDLRVRRARLTAQIEQRESDRDRLVAEAAALGVEDPRQLSTWVEERRREFDTEKERILGLLNEAEGSQPECLRPSNS